MITIDIIKLTPKEMTWELIRSKKRLLLWTNKEILEQKVLDTDSEQCKMLIKKALKLPLNV